MVRFLTAIAFWEPRAQVKFNTVTFKSFLQLASSKQLSISESVSREPLEDSLPSGPLDGFELLWLKEFGPQKSIELHFYEIIDEILGKQGVRFQPKSSKLLVCIETDCRLSCFRAVLRP